MNYVTFKEMDFAGKRRFARHPQREGVRLISKRGLEYGCYEDVSLGGLRLWLERETVEGEYLQMDFEVKSTAFGVSERFRVEGMVVHCRASDTGGYWMGVQFVNVGEQFRSRMKRLLQSSEVSRVFH